MSQTRAERRRSNRGGDAPPPRRDPMVPIYIGLAAIIVLVFAGFGITNFLQNRARQQAFDFAMATPSPGPSPTTKPIHLGLGQVVGKPMGFTQGNLQKGQSTDTKQGGLGQPVDGIQCQTTEGVTLHIHSQLSIFDNGKQAQIPAFIGMAPTQEGGCLYWIHTHDASGIIHVETPQVSAPNGGPYTIGDFFDIWGQPLTRTQVGPFKGPVTAFVNGQPYNGDLAAIPLRSHQNITFEVGSPVVPPPIYVLPSGD